MYATEIIYNCLIWLLKSIFLQPMYFNVISLDFFLLFPLTQKILSLRKIDVRRSQQISLQQKRSTISSENFPRIF